MGARIAFAFAVLLSIFFVENDSARADELYYCSAVPYPTETILIAGDGTVSLRIQVSPGECDKFAFDVSQKYRFLYSRATNSKSLLRLQMHSFFKRSWGGNPRFTFSDTDAWGCIDERTAQFKRLTRTNCNLGESRIQLGVLHKSERKHALFLEDPFLCQRTNFSCANVSANRLSEWAYTLHQSLNVSYRFFEQKHNRYGIIPFAAVFNTIDENGPFSRGIKVTEYREVTPLGSAVPARQGDIVRTFNGTPVYDRYDFSRLLIEHGNKAGYSVPYIIEIERYGERILYEGYLVFHKQVFGQTFLNSNGSCRNPTRAMLYSSLQEATFYTQPILGCVNFDLDSFYVQRQHRCEFYVQQLVAAYRQYCPSLTRYSAIIGSIFVPGREVAESVTRKFLFKSVSKLAPAITLEIAEEVSRAIATLPPGVSASGNWNSIGQQVGFGVAVGFGVRLLTL